MIEIPVWLACIVPWLIGCIGFVLGWVMRARMHEANTALDYYEREKRNE